MARQDEQKRQAEAAQLAQQQAEQKAKDDELARQQEKQRKADEIQRSAEQQRLLEIELARVEADRLKAEAARKEEAARAKEQALQAEQARQAEAEAETRRQQAIIDRRVREAAAPVSELEPMAPIEMLAQICPSLRSDSFQEATYEDNFAGRRFRYHARVTRLLDDKRIALLEMVTVGEIHLLIQATLKPEVGKKLRVNREADLAGTVTGIRFIPGITNINGIAGQVGLGQFGGYFKIIGWSSIPRASHAFLSVVLRCAFASALAVTFRGHTPLACRFRRRAENRVPKRFGIENGLTHGRVNGIGLGQFAGGAGELPNARRIDDADRHAGGVERGDHGALVAAGDGSRVAIDQVLVGHIAALMKHSRQLPRCLTGSFG